MKISRVTFVGVKTERFDDMADFTRDVLGLEFRRRDGGWAVHRFGSQGQDFFEVFRPGQYDERLLPAEAGPLTIGLEVDDLVAARAELVAAGVEIVADITWAAELLGNPNLAGFGWLFFRAPDGNLYALQQSSAPSTASEGNP
ncbi:MAG TPA: VOC family protein [Candidatus Limnocylindrales bacterium]